MSRKKESKGFQLHLNYFEENVEWKIEDNKLIVTWKPKQNENAKPPELSYGE